MDLGPGLHGAYLRSDLVERFGPYPVRAAVRAGALRSLWRPVLVDASRAGALHTRAAAALLLHGLGTAIAGPTAARLHGCTAIDPGDVHVLVPCGHASRTRAGVVVHTGPLPEDDVVECHGLRCLSAERIMVDLLCTARARDAIAIADQLLAAQPRERRDLMRARVAGRLSERRDWRGTRRGARLLGLASGRAESPAESWLVLELVDLGFPPAEVNHPVGDPAGTEIYRLDLAWPDLRIALEYNGYAVHVGREWHDERRAEDLRRRGWIVIPVTVDDLKDSRRLRRELAEAFARRGRSGLGG
jgi:hypothetical protein